MIELMLANIQNGDLLSENEEQRDDEQIKLHDKNKNIRISDNSFHKDPKSNDSYPVQSGPLMAYQEIGSDMDESLVQKNIDHIEAKL